MSAHNDIRAIVQEMVESGVEDRDAIVAHASGLVDVDPDEIRRVYFTKAVSWAITQVRDDLGRRLVYQIRENGKHLALHVGTTTNYALVRKIGMHKKAVARALDAEGDRLLTLADQIEMDFGQVAA